jgi:hypothetical protein
MRKLLLLLVITALSFNCYSQIEFENGYFIDNSDQRVECLIKNVDWQRNPLEFEYKLTENSEINTIGIMQVKEFEIDNVSKFIRSSVNIDRSSEDLSKISTEKNPVFQEEELFLKVLVEGKASLYRFADKGLERFFFKMNDSVITQLVYKTYLVNDKQRTENNHFRQQLFIELNGPEISGDYFQSLDYTSNDLVRLFVLYNELANSGYTNFQEKVKRDAFNLTLRPGIRYSSFSVQNRNDDSRSADYGNKSGFRFGIEAEFIMPFNKNKWAVIIEPTYQYFNSELESPLYDVYVDYKSVELPIGIRHYFYLNTNSKIFINGSMILDFPQNSKLRANYAEEFDINSALNMTFGIGYKLKEIYSLELRYQTPRELMNGFVFWNSDYNSLSLIFGLSIF